MFKIRSPSEFEILKYSAKDCHKCFISDRKNAIPNFHQLVRGPQDTIYYLIMLHIISCAIISQDYLMTICNCPVSTLDIGISTFCLRTNDSLVSRTDVIVIGTSYNFRARKNVYSFLFHLSVIESLS